MLTATIAVCFAVVTGVLLVILVRAAIEVREALTHEKLGRAEVWSWYVEPGIMWAVFVSLMLLNVGGV